MPIIFNRVWAMPSPDTFQIKPIKQLALKYIANKERVLDPFARNCTLGNITNDIDPQTHAFFHLEAVSFLDHLLAEGYQSSIDVSLLDPPYSPRQISECYRHLGMKCGMKETQNARLYKNCKDRLQQLCKPKGIVISCGWNSSGMGKTRGFKIIEILLVACGGAHNDYIITIDQKIE